MLNLQSDRYFSILLISGILIFSILGTNSSFAQTNLNTFSDKIGESNQILTKISESIEKMTGEKSNTGTPKIISQVKKIVLTQPVGYLTSSENSISTKFLIKNIGTTPTSSINLTPSSLNLKGNFIYSDIPNFINSTKIDLSIESQQVPVDGTTKITLTIRNIPDSELSYEGNIVISGSGFDPITLDVEYVQNIESQEFFYYILAGLFSSISIGFLLVWSEKKNQYESVVEKTNSVRDHVDEHITTLRKFLHVLSYKNNNTDNIQKSIIKIFNEKRDNMIQLYGSGELRIDSEPVVWLHNILKFLEENYISANDKIFGKDIKKLEDEDKIATLPKFLNKKTREILKKDFPESTKELVLNSKVSHMIPYISGAVASTVQSSFENALIKELREHNSKLTEKQAQEKAKRLIKSLGVTFSQKQLKDIRSSVFKDLKDPKKYAYLIAAIVISLPASILISDNISGSLATNLAFAFGTGFAIYRFKDLKELFKKEK